MPESSWFTLQAPKELASAPQVTQVQTWGGNLTASYCGLLFLFPSLLSVLKSVSSELYVKGLSLLSYLAEN